MKRIIAIGGSHAETSAFARQTGIKQLRYVTNRDFIRGLRPDELHLLPGYFTRRDRHAVAAEVKVMERKNRQMKVVTWVKVQSEFIEANELANLDVSLSPEPQLPPVNNTEAPTVTQADPPVPEASKQVIMAAPGPKTPAKPPAKRKPAAKKAPKKKPAPKKAPVVAQDREALTQDVPAKIPDDGIRIENDFFDFLDGN